VRDMIFTCAVPRCGSSHGWPLAADSARHVRTVVRFQRHDPDVHQNFAGVLEIHGYTFADRRLDLAGTPIGAARMADPLARLDGRDRSWRHGRAPPFGRMLPSRKKNLSTFSAKLTINETLRLTPVLRVSPQDIEEGMDDPLRLSELLSLRFSNDIGALHGTLMGALELALEGVGVSSDALSAAVEAGAELNLRLQLLREAWTGNATDLDLSRLDALARGLPGAHRLDVDLSALPATTVLPRSMARLVLNVLLLAAESLPRGGVIALAAADGADILVTIIGMRAAWPAGLAAYLADEEAAWAALSGPRGLLAPLVALLSHRLAVKVSLLLSSGNLPARRGRRVSAPPLLLSPDKTG
jgi:histidine phosphotransferase ChpT